MAELPPEVALQLETLKLEIAALEEESRVTIPAEMQDAQAVGPVRENADLYLVAGRAHYVQGRLLSLRQRLRAYPLSTSPASRRIPPLPPSRSPTSQSTARPAPRPLPLIPEPSLDQDFFSSMDL